MATKKSNDSVLETLIDEGEQVVRPSSQGINAINNVALNVSVLIGSAKMPISVLLGLSRGSVIELDKNIGEPVDVMVNDKLVAMGNLVKVGENGLGVTLTEIVKEFLPEG